MLLLDFLSVFLLPCHAMPKNGRAAATSSRSRYPLCIEVEMFRVHSLLVAGFHSHKEPLELGGMGVTLPLKVWDERLHGNVLFRVA
jgi:hypothetical protein